MPRSPRIAPGNIVFHVLNRGVGKMRIFDNEGDYHAFELIIEETLSTHPMRLCAYCLMPNHWHLVLWPENNGDMGRFMQRLSITHVRRWQEYRKCAGTGHVYQGRYKSFPVEKESHFLRVCRYVERNALRAGLVDKAENWRWSSLWRRCSGNLQKTEILSDWPIEPPKDWLIHVNRPETEAELETLRRCVTRGRPFGRSDWTKRTIANLGLESTVRPPGRPTRKP